jgi:hypothetical protein
MRLGVPDPLFSDADGGMSDAGDEFLVAQCGLACGVTEFPGSE